MKRVAKPRRRKLSPLYADVKRLGSKGLFAVAKTFVVPLGQSELVTERELLEAHKEELKGTLVSAIGYERIRSDGRGAPLAASIHDVARTNLPVVLRCAEAAGDLAHAAGVPRESARLAFLQELGVWRGQSPPSRETLRIWRSWLDAGMEDVDRLILCVAADLGLSPKLPAKKPRPDKLHVSLSDIDAPLQRLLLLNPTEAKDPGLTD